MIDKINTPKKLITLGATFLIIGIVVGIPLALYHLGKGEADRNFEPNLLVQVFSYMIGAMFYSGPILITAGIVWAIIARMKK